MDEVAEPFRASGCATGGNALCCMSPCKPTRDTSYIPGTGANVILYARDVSLLPAIHLACAALECDGIRGDCKTLSKARACTTCWHSW